MLRCLEINLIQDISFSNKRVPPDELPKLISFSSTGERYFSITIWTQHNNAVFKITIENNTFVHILLSVLIGILKLMMY